MQFVISCTCQVFFNSFFCSCFKLRLTVSSGSSGQTTAELMSVFDIFVLNQSVFNEPVDAHVQFDEAQTLWKIYDPSVQIHLNLELFHLLSSWCVHGSFMFKYSDLPPLFSAGFCLTESSQTVFYFNHVNHEFKSWN